MKKNYIIGGVIAIAFVIGVIFGPILNLNNTQVLAENESMKSIAVSGEYSVEVAPDVAYVTMSVETTAKTAEAAQKNNAEKMNNVNKKLKALGVDEKKITTSNYNVYPNYDWTEKNGRVLKGYNVSNQIKVEISDLAKVGNILDVAVKEGINEVTSVSFDVTDSVRKDEYKKALKEAVKDAEEKAKAIASANGTKLNKPFEISEVSQNIINRNITYDTKMEFSGTPINPDDIKVSATVKVIYKY